MGKQRQNSNYVGSKGYVAREEASQKKAAEKRKRRVIGIVTVVLVICLVISIPFATVAIVNSVKTNKMGVGFCEDYASRDLSKQDVKYVEFTVKNYGKFVVLVDATEAPETVANFIKLVNEGFYDGLTFHRANDTMIQGGDPNADGTGGSEKTIKGEFSKNKFYTNELKHKRGVISMARSSDYNSASSQFFICNQTTTSYDGEYAAFGYVVEGMSVVDEINTVMQNRITKLEGKLGAYDKMNDEEKALYSQLQNGVITKESKQPVIKSVRVLENYTPDLQTYEEKVNNIVSGVFVPKKNEDVDK